MRRIATLLLFALTLGGCSRDAAAPADASGLFDDAAALAYGGSFVGDPGSRFLELVHRLPDDLKLTADQQARIRELIEQFAAAARADREALAAILLEARQALAAGKSREEVRAILEQGLPIRQRLHAAEQALRTDILAVLTAEQRAWLDSHRPGECRAAPLTDEQRAEISALIAAFELSNRADLSAIRAALEQARTAQRNGASREEIRAILRAVQPAMERVRAAQAVLAAAIAAVLTPEQRASNCYRFPR